MPDLTHYQTVFRIAKPNAPRRGQTAKRRQQNTSTHTAEQNGNLEDEDNVSKAQARLQKLEEMVTMLMQSNQAAGGRTGQPTPPSPETLPEPTVSVPAASTSICEASIPTPEAHSNGHLDVRGSETKYLGATHYLSILENIKEIQECLASDAVDGRREENSHEIDEPDIVLSNSNPLTFADVLGSLPPRHVTDRLLSLHFNAKHLHIPFIHRGKFLREYDSFWRDPTSTSFLWISILFSALHLGYRLSSPMEQATVQSATGEGAHAFLARAAQALVAGHYQQARPYSVEATMIFAMCKFFGTRNQDTEPWLMMGVAARLALRMGYHRDPRHLAHLSPFEGEMRRRTFSTLQTFELLLSFQAGLPAIIHEQVCDTEPARNLFDDDFDEFSTAIPPSRPSTDPTPMLYYRYKGEVAHIFRIIARQALSPRPPAYQDVMQLDGELRKTRSEIPPSLVWKPLTSSITDETYSIMHRLNLELLYQKSMMILHRRYLSYDRSNPDYRSSREACVAASTQVLQYQAEVHQAGQPGGQLHNDRWLASSIALHDFLLAGMIFCLELYESHRDSDVRALSEAEAQTQAKKYNVLKTSQEIWQMRQNVSPDAKRAATVLRVMLSKIRGPVAPLEARLPHGDISASHHDDSKDVVPQTMTTEIPLELSMPPGSESFEVLTLPPTDLNPLEVTDFPSQDFLDAVFADSEMLDWSVLDQYIHEGKSPAMSFDS